MSVCALRTRAVQLRADDTGGEMAFRSGGLLGVMLIMSVLLCLARNSLRRLKKKRPGLWRDVMLLIKILVSFTQ